MQGIEGKAALVTGAASGIGLAIARDLAQHGARVMLCDVNAARGEALAAELPGAAFCAADLTREADVERVVAETRAALGEIAILVNNAGFQHVAPLESFPVEQWRRILDLMLTAPFLLTRAVLPAMYARGWGRIVNIASVHALRASPLKAAYVSAKHGLLGLTRVTALEGAAHGVTCNAVCPSYVRTPLVEQQIPDLARQHGIAEERVVAEIMTARSAIHRLLEPEEVAHLVSYLCSEAAAGITGSAQVIDCGWTAH
jgi:3-hydroxybutyrate dehydrogenase